LTRSVDVNVLLHASFDGSPVHAQAQDVLRESVGGGGGALLVPSVVASGYLRLSTDRRVFRNPKRPCDALAFLDALLGAPSVSLSEPGARHWSLFRGLVEEHSLTGPDVPDAYIAALAMERGATLVSYDRGFARFRGLRWLNPAEPE